MKNIIRLSLTYLLILIAFTFVSNLDISPAFGAALPVNEAQKAFKEKDFNKVTELLMPFLAELKKDEILILGKSYSELSNSLLAVKVFSTGVSQHPQDSEIKSLLGYEQFKANKISEAILTLKEVTETDKKYLPAYQFLIQIFERKANRYELRLVYQDLIERFGEKPEFVTKLCELSVLESQYELGIKYCQLGVSLSPKEPTSLVYFGIALKDTGKTEEAEKNLKRAADSFSKSELAQLTFAQYHEDKKNQIEAFKYFTRAIQANPESIKGLIGVGVSGTEIQKLQEGLAAFEKACKLDKSSTLYFRRAIKVLKVAKNQTWLEKFEAALERCR